jgi:cobaltochelatase CobS
MEIQTTIKDVLGRLPFEGADGLDLNAYTRAAARTWLSRCGWNARLANELDLDQLRAAYSDNGSLNKLAGERSQPMVEFNDGQEAARAGYQPRNEKLLEYLKAKANGRAPIVTEVEPEPAPSLPMPLPASRKPAANDKAAQLAALIADLAGERDAPLNEARVVELIKAHAPKPEDRIVERFITVPSSMPARVLEDKPRHKAFPEVLAAVAADLNVMLVGPAGAGKTHLCADVAKALDLPFSFTGALDSPYKLLGFTDAQGRTVRTPYRESYEHGRVFLFDEIDASAPAALLAFNAGLSNGHQDFPDACVTRHESFRAIASANTYGCGQDRVYVGRNQLDAASLDRFVVIAMDYDSDLEAALFGRTPWLDYCHNVRAAVSLLKIRHVVSMRAIEQGTKLLAAGLPLERVKALALWKGLDAASVAKIEAEAR